MPRPAHGVRQRPGFRTGELSQGPLVMGWACRDQAPKVSPELGAQSPGRRWAGEHGWGRRGSVLGCGCSSPQGPDPREGGTVRSPRVSRARRSGRVGRRTVGAVSRLWSAGRAATQLAEHSAAQQGCKEPHAQGGGPSEERGHLRAWAEVEGPRLSRAREL